MKLKKLSAAALLFCGLCAVPSAAHAADSVVSTDICAFIDECPIESYNYRDYTYIVAEDLRNYGFDVAWNPNERSLSITRGERVFAPYIDAEIINRQKETPTFEKLYDVYPTDIKTFVNGKAADAINVNGKTLINTDWLGEWGNCTYDNDKRQYKVDIIGKEIEGLEKRPLENTDSYSHEKGYDAGVFENGELVYGIKYRSGWKTRIDIERGDFKNKKTVYSSTGYGPESYSFKNGEDSAYCPAAGIYRYGMIVLNLKKNGKEYRYLADNGQLYLIREGTDDQAMEFNGELYDRGQKIYSGRLYCEEFCHRTDYPHDFYIMRAEGYNNPNGRIYHWDSNNIYYEGHVENGLPHGVGTVFDRSSQYEYGIDFPTARLVLPDGTVKNIENVGCSFFKGHFRDGVLDGEGTYYERGFPAMSGIFDYGNKNGVYTEYKTAYDADGNEFVYQSYKGTVNDNYKNGEGTEWRPFGEGRGNCRTELYVSFEGEYKDGQQARGKLYQDTPDGSRVYMWYDGELNYDNDPNRRYYGTRYREDGSVEYSGYFTGFWQTE